MKYITCTIWILSLVSLFTDVGSEMLYPVVPLYLKSIGFSIVFIGLLEGFAEATIGLSKGYFGKRSDNLGKRVPFVQLGYILSAISRPLIVLFAQPAWVFLVRTMDRLGKGIRTGARDAMLSDESTPQTKGRVFGFHRTMDTFGAVFGPAIALIYLYYHPGQYKALFLIAVLPGAIAIVTSMLLRESSKTRKDIKEIKSFFSFLSYWKQGPRMYRKVVSGFIVFALFNSSDVFLVLRVKDAGLSDDKVMLVYIFYNLIYALLSLPLGMLGDKIGLRKTFVFGIFMFAVMYAGMAFEMNLMFYLILFACYGIYSAATEGILKAWVSNIAAPTDTATAIGLFSGFQSIALFLASSITGLIWFKFGAVYAFAITSAVAVCVLVYFLWMKEENVNS